MRTKTLEQNTAQDFAGLQIDQLSKLRNGNITFEQVKWFNNLTFEQREALMGKQPEKALYLKLLSGAETLMLDALDGKETLATAKETFPSGIDGNFKNWGTNKPGIATKETAVDVYELVKDGNFAQMFGSLGTDLDKLCLTQAQIKNFCKKHPQLLRQNGYATFFLFKVEDQFFVARVYVNSDGLYVNVNRFVRDNVWGAGSSHRMVVPKMIVFSYLILLSERSFLFKAFSPTAEHFTYLIQLFGEQYILVV